MIRQAYRFALDPSASQERMLRSRAGAARFAWNWGLAKCTERYAAEGTWYSAIDLHRLWNAVKRTDPALAARVPEGQEAGKCKDSFRFSTGVMRCSGTTVTLPRLGTIRTHESTRKLARRLENDAARILSATVSRTAQRWFVSFTVEFQRAIPDRHPRPGSAAGVDLGGKGAADRSG